MADFNALMSEALKGGGAVMYAATPCTADETLAETIRLRSRYRSRDPLSQRTAILEKDVLVQCQALGVSYIA